MMCSRHLPRTPTPFAPHAHEADPAEEAGRNLDWQAFLAVHPLRHRLAILVLIDGGTMREAGKRCGLRDSAALNLRRRIAADLIEFFGEEEIRRLLNGRMPAWEAGWQASRHRHLCHSSLVNGREVARSEGQVSR
jgi:hypothetical protein